uniref:Uncharacterized protein n=1 Tax=Rhizophora mucronata TaxID=61149 RepID=A0A2P2N8A2_RHIMU
MWKQLVFSFPGNGVECISSTRPSITFTSFLLQKLLELDHLSLLSLSFFFLLN